MLRKTQNRLLQHHLGIQLDLCSFVAFPPIQHFSDDIQCVALIGAVALNSVDFATVASNSAVFIHQSNHPRYFFVVFCCVK